MCEGLESVPYLPSSLGISQKNCGICKRDIEEVSSNKTVLSKTDGPLFR